MMLNVAGDAVIHLMKKEKLLKRGSATETEQLDVQERHEYHVELILSDTDARVEGALVTEKKRDEKAKTTYQLVEVTRLRQ